MDDESIVVDDDVSGETSDTLQPDADIDTSISLFEIDVKLDDITSSLNGVGETVGEINAHVGDIVDGKAEIISGLNILLEQLESEEQSEIEAYSEEPTYTAYEQAVLDQLTYLNTFCFLFAITLGGVLVYRFLKIFF